MGKSGLGQNLFVGFFVDCFINFCLLVAIILFYFCWSGGENVTGGSGLGDQEFFVGSFISFFASGVTVMEM